MFMLVTSSPEDGILQSDRSSYGTSTSLIYSNRFIAFTLLPSLPPSPHSRQTYMNTLWIPLEHATANIHRVLAFFSLPFCQGVACQ